jgi:hypothetical protein
MLRPYVRFRGHLVLAQRAAPLLRPYLPASGGVNPMTCTPAP